MAENGGKSKRVGLSLKSFKKPASNSFKKHSVGQRLNEVPSSKCTKSSSNVETINLTNEEDGCELPLSQNRMKLLKLMPTFPNWNFMDPIPINPLMKSLIEQKSDITQETPNIMPSASTVSNTKELTNKSYVDFPKLGMHYLSQRMKTQLLTVSEDDESCMETDILKQSEIDVEQKGVPEDEFDIKISSSIDSTHSILDKNKEQPVFRMKQLGNVEEEGNSHVLARRKISKVNSLCSRRNAEAHVQGSVSKFKPTYADKADTTKSTRMSSYVSNDMHKVDSVCDTKDIETHEKVDKAKGNTSKYIVKSNSTPNSIVYTSNNMSTSESHVQESKSKRKDSCSSKSIPKSNRTFNNSQRDPSVYDGNEVLKVNSSDNARVSETHVKNKFKGNPTYSSQEIPKLNNAFNASNREPQSIATMNSVYSSKNLSNVSNFYNATNRTKRAKLSVTAKSIDKNKKIEGVDNLNCTVDRKQYGKDRKPKKRSVFAREVIPTTHSSYRKDYEEADVSVNQRLTAAPKLGIYCSTPKKTADVLDSGEDLFGDDDDLDEILAATFTDDLDVMQKANPGNQGNNKDSKEDQWIEKNTIDDDDDLDDLIGNLGDDMDDDALMACCDDVMSPTIPFREKASIPKLSGSLNEIASKGVKRKLNIHAGPSKIRRSDDACDRLKQCPLCAISFISRFSIQDIDQHVAMCCGGEEIGKDDAFW